MLMMLAAGIVLLLHLISTPTHGAPAFEKSQELSNNVPRASSLRSNAAPAATRSQSRRLRNTGDAPDRNEERLTTMDRTDRKLDEDFPTRAPHFNFWYLTYPPDESPTRAPSALLALEAAEEEKARTIYVPTIAPSNERIPTRAPTAAFLSLQSAEEPLLPTRAPQFDVEEEPTRAPLWEGRPLRSDEETTTPIITLPTSAPTFHMETPIISGFTARPTNLPTKSPCYVCGSMNQEITKAEEIVTTDTTLFGSCFDVASRGTYGGFDNCDEMQALVAQVCGCETVIASSSSPTDTQESRGADGTSTIAGTPSSSCPGQGSVALVVYLGALWFGIVLI